MKYRELKAFDAVTFISYLSELKGQEHNLYTLRFLWWFPLQQSNVPELSLTLLLLYTISFSAAVE